MKSELQFFMKKIDEEEFFKVFNGRWERTVTNFSFSELWFGSNYIQFCSSKIYGNQLTSGRIAYMTIDYDDARAEKLYKEMRKYIRGKYRNKMRAVSMTLGSAQTCNTIYYSNTVTDWINENPDNILVQFKDGFIKFIPEPS